MKELSDDELVSVLNRLRINSVKFTHEKDSKITGYFPYDMLSCKNGWTFVGWAEADSVGASRMEAPFVCMFEQEDGTQSWCHAAFVSLEAFAYQYLEKNPDILD